MTTLSSIFGSEDSVPSAWRIDAPIEQREYLVDGKLETWQGSVNPVLSPVFVLNNGRLEQKVLGTTPLLTSKEAMIALEAAVRAYDLGHGHWPTLSVTDRIEHV
jgi:glyceraldehyde-3-phosphate dehydrogenase (NADP+)